MIILLPPSETKRDGGVAEPVDLASLRFSALTEIRAGLVRDLALLASDEQASLKALKLSARQLAEVHRNRELRFARTLPAIDRYTGVLYDALDSASLTAGEREFAGRHVLIHSALFGPVGALDPIPPYRLSHNSQLPGVSLKKLWSSEVRDQIGGAGLVLDFRSEGYVGLGPVPEQAESLFLRVVAVDPSGARRALNHFNKKYKGILTRALVQSGIDFSSAAQLTRWGSENGFALSEQSGDLILTIDEPLVGKSSL
jgi:cytoplasmic iron level regulating protein YaaA (DUF328/UPF0246 family)